MKNKAGWKNKMKPIINPSCNIVILCLCLIAPACLHCRRRSDHTLVHESKITVFSMGDELILGPYWEMPAKFLVFLPLVSLDEELEPQDRLAQADWFARPSANASGQR